MKSLKTVLLYLPFVLIGTGLINAQNLNDSSTDSTNYTYEEIREYLSREYLIKSHFDNIYYIGDLKRAIMVAKRYTELGQDSSYIWLFKSISEDINKLHVSEELAALKSYLIIAIPDSALLSSLFYKIDLRFNQLSSIEQKRLLEFGFKDVRLSTNLKGLARNKVEKFRTSLNRIIKKEIAKGDEIIFTPILLEVNETSSSIVQITLTGTFDEIKLKEDVESRSNANNNTPEINEIFQNRFVLTEQAFGYIEDLNFEDYENQYTVIVRKPSSRMTVEFNGFKHLIHNKAEIAKGMITKALQGEYSHDSYKDIIGLHIEPDAYLNSKKGREEVVDILKTEDFGSMVVHYLSRTPSRTSLTGEKSPEDLFLEYFSIK